MKKIVILLTILCLPSMVLAGGKTIKGEVRNSSGETPFQVLYERKRNGDS